MKIIHVPELPKTFVYISEGYEIRGSGESFNKMKSEKPSK
jgi:hypothetical protein